MTAGERQRDRIMHAGCAIWQINPEGVTCRAVARAAGINHATILYHYETTEAFKDALADYAVQRGISRIIAQLIATNHPAVSRLSAAERADHLGTLADMGRYEVAPEQAG